MANRLALANSVNAKRKPQTRFSYGLLEVYWHSNDFVMHSRQAYRLTQENPKRLPWFLVSSKNIRCDLSSENFHIWNSKSNNKVIGKYTLHACLHAMERRHCKKNTYRSMVNLILYGIAIFKLIVRCT